MRACGLRRVVLVPDASRATRAGGARSRRGGRLGAFLVEVLAALGARELPAGRHFEVSLDDGSGDVPDSGGGVLGGGDDAEPVRAEGGAFHPSGVAAKLGELLARSRVPDSGGEIVGCGDDAEPVRTEGGAEYLVGVAAKLGELLARGCVPDSGGGVSGRGGD